MCAETHLAREYQYRVKRYSKRKKNSCIHVVAQCTNCQGNHQANFFYACPDKKLRYKPIKKNHQKSQVTSKNYNKER